MLRELEIDEEWIHEIVRRKILHDQAEVTQLAFEAPDLAQRRAASTASSASSCPRATTSTKHFTPEVPAVAAAPGVRARRRPVRRASAAGKASVVTDEIETFTENGILTKSGEELEADIIVTATGFNLSVLGDIAFTVDGEPVDFADTVTYRGMMFTGVPNLLWVFGYFRASWTLRADLIGDFVCRLLHHMDDLGRHEVTPQLRPEDADMPIGCRGSTRRTSTPAT